MGTVSAALLLALTFSRPAEGQELGWTRMLEASGNILFGAAHGRLVSFAAGATRADSALEIRGDAQLTYADSRDDDGRRSVTARSSRATFALDHRPFHRVSPFVFGSVETSLQQRVARRYSTGAGAKLTLQRREGDEASVSLALLWEHSRALDPPPESPATATRVRWSMRLRVRRQLSEKVSLTHVTFYQPAIDRPARYTADSNTSLAAAISESLALSVSLRDRYDSEARGRGAPSNHDGQLLFGVRASF